MAGLFAGLQILSRCVSSTPISENRQSEKDYTMKNKFKGFAIGIAALALTAVVTTAPERTATPAGSASPETALEASPVAKELTVQLKITGMT